MDEWMDGWMDRWMKGYLKVMKAVEAINVGES